MSSAILDNLNPSQKEAVTWPTSPLLILAGAGSGKTRILTRRIAYLIEQGVPPFQILGVTFTNKAAKEMKLRVQQLVDRDVWVSTFHSTCLRILRMDGPVMGLDRGFSIYDESDQLTLIKEVLKEMQINEKQVNPKAVRERIQRAKDILMTPYQYAEKSEDLFEETVAKVYRGYEEKLDRLKACDFGDLIMKTVALFDKHSRVLQTWQDRFQHILIDEYQDTNHAQYRLIKLLASGKKQITVVGDPDQSIYAWRGADIKNILSFEKDYPHCGIIRMEQNYRSSAVILDAANELIARNEIRKPKNLWTDREGGDLIGLKECYDERAEADYVVGEIIRQQSRGKTLADQVIFYRTHAQSRVIEDSLRRNNIPYRIIGGTRFYDRKEIKDIIAYLKAIANPHDDVSLKRIINVPTRGVGKKALEILEMQAREKQCSLDDVLQSIQSVSGLTPRARRSLSTFHGMMRTWRRRALGENPIGLEELLELVLSETGYVNALKEEKTIESQSRIENIEEFFSVIEEFDANGGEITAGLPKMNFSDKESEEETPEAPSLLHSFLENISLMTNLDNMEDGTNVLTMMTFHTAKGLEYPLVYMVGLEEGIFPNGNSFGDDPEEIEEERRLCYVGVTRAKEKVTMTYAIQRRLYGAVHQNLPSRFLNEIPQHLFETMPGKGKSLSAFDEIDGDILDDHDIEIDFDDPDGDHGESTRRILFD